MEKERKILIIDDDTFFQDVWETLLEGSGLYILRATSIPEADKMFDDNPDIELIALDGCVPGHQLNTLQLATKFSTDFSGPIIAISGVSQFQEELIRYGCNGKCEKGILHKKILAEFGIQDC